MINAWTGLVLGTQTTNLNIKIVISKQTLQVHLVFFFL